MRLNKWGWSGILLLGIALIIISLKILFNYTSFEITCWQSNDSEYYLCKVLSPHSWDLDLQIPAMQHCTYKTYNSMRDCATHMIKDSECKDIGFINFDYYENNFQEGQRFVPTPLMYAKCKPLSKNPIRNEIK